MPTDIPINNPEQIFGRLVWGLGFIKSHIDKIPSENRGVIDAAFAFADRNLGEDWFVVGHEHRNYPAMLLRLKKVVERYGATFTTNMIAYFRNAVAFGFERLRDETDYQLALAEADQAYWSGLLAVLQVPEKLLAALTTTTTTTLSNLLGLTMKTILPVALVLGGLWYLSSKKRDDR